MDQELVERLKKTRTKEEADREIENSFPGMYSPDERAQTLDAFAKAQGKLWEQPGAGLPKPEPTITERFRQNPGKSAADMALGAAPGLVTGNIPMAAGGAFMNLFANEGQPVTSAGNIANVAAGPFGKISQGLMKAPQLTNILGKAGAMATVPVAENVATTFAGRTGAELAGTPSPNSAQQEYTIAAGAPTALNMLTAMGTRGSRLAPGIWQRLIAKQNSMDSPENVEQSMSFLKKKADASVEPTNLFKELAQFQKTQAKSEHLAQVAQKTAQQISQEASAARKKLQEFVERRQSVVFEVGDEALESKKLQTEARKSIQDAQAKIAEEAAALRSTKAANKIAKFEGNLTPEDELSAMHQEKDAADRAADLHLSVGELRNTLEDQNQFQRNRQNVAEFASKNKTEKELAAKQKLGLAEEAASASRQRVRKLTTDIESGSYDVKAAEKELQGLIQKHNFDPSLYDSDEQALLLSMAKSSPETVIRESMKMPTSETKKTLENFMKLTSGRPELQDSLRTAFAKELIKPTEIFTHGTQKQVGEAGTVAADFVRKVEDLGQDSINTIFNSKNAYRNLKSYGKLMERAQMRFPAGPGAGSLYAAAMAAGGGFALPLFFRSGLGPVLGGAAIASIPAYISIQAPAMINRLIRMNPTMSNLFEKMATNPEKFMSGSASSRLLNSYLRKTGTDIFVERDGKPLKIKAN